jgi:hypothetical protein
MKILPQAVGVGVSEFLKILSVCGRFSAAGQNQSPRTVRNLTQ